MHIILQWHVLNGCHGYKQQFSYTQATPCFFVIITAFMHGSGVLFQLERYNIPFSIILYLSSSNLKGLIHGKQGLWVVGLSDGFVYQLRHDISAVSKSDRSATLPGG
jgi:hypothetical protein